ncbi:MAG: nicotinate phosphoribosyltransferase [Longimicrobiales bacterium]
MAVTPDDPSVGRADLALLTDLYQLTMLQAYWQTDMHELATFSLFVRHLPAARNYLLACGLDDALAAVSALRFQPAHIEYLRSLGFFQPEFLDWLQTFRFQGDVYGVPEGTPVFAEEPILEVVAPIAQAQLIETAIMNQVHVQTVIASKAARIVAAARARPVVDFGLRRAAGTDAGMKLARASFIAGTRATSNLLAGQRYGIPVAGTMAHSFVQAFDDEYDALRAFAQLYPGTTLLVDTYDTLQGVRNVIQLAAELGPQFNVRALRLDSGDLVALSRQARQLLDEAGLSNVQLFASGGLDEYALRDLLDAGASFDGFGVGTRLAVSEDAPSLDMAYKLTSYAQRDRFKLSTGKRSLPGQKQVFRVERDGRAVHDVIGRFDERLDGRPLLQPVMQNGARLLPPVPLPELQQRTRAALATLPEPLHSLEPAEQPYPVTLSAHMEAALQWAAQRKED